MSRRERFHNYGWHSFQNAVHFPHLLNTQSCIVSRCSGKNDLLVATHLCCLCTGRVTLHSQPNRNGAQRWWLLSERWRLFYMVGRTIYACGCSKMCNSSFCTFLWWMCFSQRTPACTCNSNALAFSHTQSGAPHLITNNIITICSESVHNAHCTRSWRLYTSVYIWHMCRLVRLVVVSNTRQCNSTIVCCVCVLCLGVYDGFITLGCAIVRAKLYLSAKQRRVHVKHNKPAAFRGGKLGGGVIIFMNHCRFWWLASAVSDALGYKTNSMHRLSVINFSHMQQKKMNAITINCRDCFCGAYICLCYSTHKCSRDCFSSRFYRYLERVRCDAGGIRAHNAWCSSTLYTFSNLSEI